MTGPPERDERPGRETEALKVSRTGDSLSLSHATDDVPPDALGRVARAVIVQAMLDTDPKFWERRAQQLEAARPVPGDYTGAATRGELSAQWRRLTEAAAACRARAHLSPLDLIDADVDAVLREVT